MSVLVSISVLILGSCLLFSDTRNMVYANWCLLMAGYLAIKKD